MHVTTVAWTSIVDLRRTVLGYPSSPVPGDRDVDTVHLAIDDAGCVLIAPSLPVCWARESVAVCPQLHYAAS